MHNFIISAIVKIFYYYEIIKIKQQKFTINNSLTESKFYNNY